MKRLLEEAEPSHDELTALVASAQRHEPKPFAKRLVQSRLSRALSDGPTRFAGRPVWLGAAALLVAASAAAAGYSAWAAPEPAPSEGPARPAIPSAAPVLAPLTLTPPTAPALEPAPSAVEKPLERRADKPRPGEDPSQVAEAVRALRKLGDPARAQSLLDAYLRSNPRGALAEDALALSIEAAVARKDPRAAEQARRYLARYPQGRFRGMAERVLAR